MRLSNFYVFIVLLSSILACNRNDEITKTLIDIDKNDVEFLFRSSLSGTVINTEGMPIEGVKITANGEDFFSGQDGYFNISNTLLNDTGEVITFSKPGYFSQFEKIVPEGNSFQSLFISMYEKTGYKTVKTSENTNISFYNGEISFSNRKNNLITNNSELYNGNANIYLKSSGDQNQFPPIIPNSGSSFNLNGINSQGNLSLIYPVVSFLIQCETENAKQLFFKDSVNLSFSKNIIPVEGQKITLWHYDEINGNWHAKQNFYVDFSSDRVSFNIKDQGYYLLGPDFSDLKEISGRITYSNGLPVKFSDLLFSDKNSGFFTFAFTDEKGEYFIQVPEGSDIVMSITNCFEPGFEYQLGFINADKVFNVAIDDQPVNIQINSVLNHNGQPANNAFAEIKSGIFISEYYKIKNDSTGQNIQTGDCNPQMILYVLDDLPLVRQSAQIDLTQNFNTSDYHAKFETQSYLYLYDNMGQIEKFDAQPLFYIEDGIYYLMNNSFEMGIFLKFGKTGQDKYEGDIAFVSLTNQELQVFESDPSDPVKLEITTNNSNEIGGSFTGKVTINNLKTDITGYFKIQK